MNVVRASNILNLNYFSESQITDAINLLWEYLHNDGLLLASRNGLLRSPRNANAPSEQIERGSIWRKDKKGFVHIIDFGGGSEIKSIVNKFYNRKA